MPTRPPRVVPDIDPDEIVAEVEEELRALEGDNNPEEEILPVGGGFLDSETYTWDTSPAVTVTGGTALTANDLINVFNSSYTSGGISDSLLAKVKAAKKKKKPEVTGYIRNLSGQAILNLYRPIRETLFEHAELTQADMRNMDLSFVRFHDIHFRGSDFSGSNLTGAVFEACNLTYCNFEGVSLKGCQIMRTPMENSNAIRANFTGARLSNINFGRSSVQNANFKRANMYDVIFGRSNLTDTNFSRATMQEVDFLGAVIVRTRMTKAKLGLVWAQNTNDFIDWAQKKRTHECHLYYVSAPDAEGKRTYVVDVIDEERSERRKIVGFTLRDAKRHAGII